jgi:hypothetical protein
MYEYFLKSMMSAAEELASHPEYSGNNAAQERVCRKWGFSMNDLTDDQFKEFSSLVNNYCGR